MNDENTRLKSLRDRLEKGVLQRVPDSFVTGDRLERLPNTANIAFQHVEGEGVILLLNRCGITCSFGSACTSGSLDPSHVLRAMDIPHAVAHATIRFSFSRDVTRMSTVCSKL